MIEAQLFLWVLISLVSGLITYYILTEGENNYLLVMTFFFSLFFGLGTSYLWVQTTNGLAAFSWGVVVLPVLFSFAAELLLLSFYAFYHKTKTLPRVPKFTSTRVASTMALVIIFFLSFLLASVYTLPSEDSQPAVAILGSSQTATITATDITTANLADMPGQEIIIQNSVVTPLTMRSNPRVGENMDFKAEFTPSISYVQPSLAVFVQDSNGNLVNENNIVLSNDEGNTVEGQILCDEAGTFTITVLVYDLMISSSIPMAASTQAYTVQSLTTGDSGINTTISLFLFSILSLALFLILAIKWKKHS